MDGSIKALFLRPKFNGFLNDDIKSSTPIDFCSSSNDSSEDPLDTFNREEKPQEQETDEDERHDKQDETGRSIYDISDGSIINQESIVDKEGAGYGSPQSTRENSTTAMEDLQTELAVPKVKTMTTEELQDRLVSMERQLSGLEWQQRNGREVVRTLKTYFATFNRLVGRAQEAQQAGSTDRRRAYTVDDDTD